MIERNFAFFLIYSDMRIFTWLVHLRPGLLVPQTVDTYMTVNEINILSLEQ